MSEVSDRELSMSRLYERAEDCATLDVPLEEALQAVRDGYSSIEADRQIAEDDPPEFDFKGPPEYLKIMAWCTNGEQHVRANLVAGDPDVPTWTDR